MAKKNAKPDRKPKRSDRLVARDAQDTRELAADAADRVGRRLERWTSHALRHVARPADLSADGQRFRRSTRAADRAERILRDRPDLSFDYIDRLVTYSRDALRIGGIESLTPADRAVLVGHRNASRHEAHRIANEYFERASSVMRRAIRSGQDVTEVQIELDELLGPIRRGLVLQGELVHFEGLQTLVARHSTPSTRFRYLGPSPQRPFCHHHWGKIYTRQQIDQMDNGQLPNTFLTRGGFNCRHHWAPVKP